MRPSAGRALLVLFALVALAAGSPAGAEPRSSSWRSATGRWPTEVLVVRVRQGDDVTLRWTTDTTLLIHLHGYDLERKLSRAAPVLMRFVATATGRFPIEVHAHGSGGEPTLGYLEVHPR